MPSTVQGKGQQVQVRFQKSAHATIGRVVAACIGSSVIVQVDQFPR